MKLRNKLIIAAVALAAAFLAGRFFGPKQVEIREIEKIKYIDRVVESKDSHKEKRVIETQRPDGTKVTETIEIDKEKTSKDTKKGIVKENDFLKVITNRPDWRIGLQYQPHLPSYQNEVYTLNLERRILGEFYVGVNASSDKTAGLSISFGF